MCFQTSLPSSLLQSPLRPRERTALTAAIRVAAAVATDHIDASTSRLRFDLVLFRSERKSQERGLSFPLCHNLFKQLLNAVHTFPCPILWESHGAAMGQ